MFAKWTIDGMQHQFNKNWLDGVSQEHTGLLVLKKIKSISLPEQNYFTHFAMRYPVLHSHLLMIMY